MADVSREMGMEVLYGGRRVISPAEMPGITRPIPIEPIQFLSTALLYCGSPWRERQRINFL